MAGCISVGAVFKIVIFSLFVCNTMSVFCKSLVCGFTYLVADCKACFSSYSDKGGLFLPLKVISSCHVAVSSKFRQLSKKHAYLNALSSRAPLLAPFVASSFIDDWLLLAPISARRVFSLFCRSSTSIGSFAVLTISYCWLGGSGCTLGGATT